MSSTSKRVLSVLLTVAIFAYLLHRMPYDQLGSALAGADYSTFLLLMVPHGILYFCWDTLVLWCVVRWFHSPVRYWDLLPVRAASYVVAVFNTNVARAAVAGYLARRTRTPFMQLGSSVIFLLMTEFTHLVGWATIGVLLKRAEMPAGLLWVPPGVALFWIVFLLYTRLNLTPWGLVRALVSPEAGSRAGGGIRDWNIFRTFRLAPVKRYWQVVLVRCPMFAASLVIHYYAARSFGLHIPFYDLLMFLPVIFMIAALPITVARLGTTQAAWILFFGHVAPAAQLLAFSLAAHLTFTITRAGIGGLFLWRAYTDLTGDASRVHGVGADPSLRGSASVGS